MPSTDMPTPKTITRSEFIIEMWRRTEALSLATPLVVQRGRHTRAAKLKYYEALLRFVREGGTPSPLVVAALCGKGVKFIENLTAGDPHDPQ